MPVDQLHCMLVAESAAAVKSEETAVTRLMGRSILFEVFETVAAAAGLSPAIKRKSGSRRIKLFIFLNGIRYTSAESGKIKKAPDRTRCFDE